VRYRCIHRRRFEYPIRMMCSALGVSPSGYYAWRSRPESRRAAYDRELTRVIRRLHAESDGTYGSPRLHLDLQAEGYPCGRAKVARLMRLAGLKGCPKRRFRVTRRRGTAPAANLLDQDFSAEQVNQRWASDITFIWTGEGWLYLAVVMDLYSRGIVGWSMSRRIDRTLAVNALKMAIAHRQPNGRLIHHSDRGSQYASEAFTTVLADHGLRASMSRKGNCYDNAAMESFFHTLKTEHVRHLRYRCHAEARASLFDYIESFYNRKRLHSTLGYMSPDEFERACTEAA